MRISNVSAADVAEYLRLDDDAYDELLEPIMDAAKAYIKDETALSDEELDEHEDLAIAYLVLCQDMYDNRTYTDTESGNSGPHANLVVSSILGHHRSNLV